MEKATVGAMINKWHHIAEMAMKEHHFGGAFSMPNFRRYT